MTSKSKTETKTTDTALALSAAEQSKALAESKLAEREQVFETLQSAEAFQQIVEARLDVELKTRLHGFALVAHEKYEAKKLAAERAEQERVRLAELARIADDNAKIMGEAVAAAETISKLWARAWANRIAEQGFGGPGIDLFSGPLRVAFSDSLVSAGLSANAIRVQY